MTLPGTQPRAEFPADSSRKPGVFLSWSGRESSDLSAALKRLIEESFANRIGTWQSKKDLRGPNFEVAIREALRASDVALVTIGPDSLSSMWLMYEAGAFFGEKGREASRLRPGGSVFTVGCGVDATVLADTPFHSLHLWNVTDRADVQRLLESIADAVGEARGDLAARFDVAWEPFAEAVAAIRQRTADETAARRHRQRWQALLLAIAALVLAGGTTTWALWPDPPPCTTGSDEIRANCRWQQYLKAYAASGPAARKPIAKRVSRRPFAVVRIVPACVATAVGPARIVVQEGADDGWSMPVVFAKSSSENANNAYSAAIIKIGDQLTIAKPGDCVTLPSGQLLQVRYIGTLSDDEVCEKFDAVRRAFDGAPPVNRVPAFQVEFTNYLRTFALGSVGSESRTPEGWLQEWVEACAVHEVKP
jgi:hypothetical protein